MKHNKHSLLLAAILAFFSISVFGQSGTISFSQYCYTGALYTWPIDLKEYKSIRISYSMDVAINSDCLGFQQTENSYPDYFTYGGYEAGTAVINCSNGIGYVSLKVNSSGYKSILVQYSADNPLTTNGNLNVLGNAAVSGTATVVGCFSAGSNAAKIKLMDFPSQASWIDMPIVTSKASGIGMGGPGQNLWIGYAGGASNWFSNSAVGDICYRNLNGKLLFGNTSGNAAMALTGNKLGIGTVNPKGILHIKAPGANYFDGSLLFENSTSSSVYGFINSGNDLYLGYNSNVSGGFPQANYQNRLIIKSDGSVGVGISPETKLDVNGNLFVRGWDSYIGSKNTEGNLFHLIGTYQGWNKDAIYIAGYNASNNSGSGAKYFSVGGATAERLWVDLISGNVGIGVIAPQHKLDVKGTICADEVMVKTVDWADFVFEKDYKLRDLKEVDQFIQDNGCLPDMPSAATVKEKGVNIAEVQAKLLQKLEELTLYTIQLKKEIEQLKAAKK